jgi:hypothetical protein
MFPLGPEGQGSMALSPKPAVTMAAQDITVSRPGFQSGVTATLRELWGEQDFTDVTLATADDQQIKAHKAILASNSPFFRNILVKNPHQNPLLYLKNVHISELRQVLQFIYLGECDMPEGDLAVFLALGRDLRVTGLNQQDLDRTTAQQKGKERRKERSQSESNVRKCDQPTNNTVDTVAEAVDGLCLNGITGPIPKKVISHSKARAKLQEGATKNSKKVQTGIVDEDDESDQDDSMVSGFINLKPAQSKHSLPKQSSNKIFTCTLCDASYDEMKLMNRHMKAKHRT